MMEMNDRSDRWQVPIRAIQLVLAVFLLGAVLSGCNLLFPTGYTVAFDSNGGAGAMTEQTLDKDEQTTLPVSTLTREGYTFAGWATTAEGSVAYADEASFTMESADVTLYAVWSANTGTAYTVEHYQQDTSGSGYTKVTADTESLSGTTGETVTASANTYTGFSENTSYTDRVASGTIAGDGSLVLKLYYDRDTYTVEYLSNWATGGAPPSDQTKLYGVDLTLSDNSDPLERDGYTFVRWNTAGNGTGTDYAEGATYSANEDATLYAQWSAETHSLSFDANGGTGSMDDVDLDTDEETTLPANAFSKDGKSFSGWATSAVGSVEYEDEDDYTMGTEDATLYAVWADLTIGDRGPAGGCIFYDDTLGYDFNGDRTITSDEKDLLDGTNDGTVMGDRYLEAAPDGWHTPDTVDPGIAWGGLGANITGLSDALGAGEANTNAIVTALSSRSRVAIDPPPEPEPEPEYAATACADYSVTVDGEVYIDWFLPSTKELVVLTSNTRSIPLQITLENSNYWTSNDNPANGSNYATEVSAGYTDAGEVGYSYRLSGYHVRPVRAF